MNKKMPIIAICYDFDKTLTPDDMQAQGFIQSVENDVEEFWKKSNSLAKENNMDQNLAYMFQMSDESTGRLWITKKSLEEYGEKIKYFPGVDTWFKRMNVYGEKKGVVIEHYVISSGLKEMIDGTSIANEFKRIYACSFYYGPKGNALWPAQSVNYTNKTQYLFRIEKGTLDVYDQRVNDHFQSSEIRIPFSNMVYIGDSDTDVPCMKVVDEYGGYSIGVYDPDINDKSKVLKIYKDGRIKLFAPAIYEKNSELEKMVKAIIDKIAASDPVNKFYQKCQKEAMDDSRTEEQIQQDILISKLEESDSFARTHSIIKECVKYDNWTKDRVTRLCINAQQNSQISSIISDNDIKLFYRKIIASAGTKTEPLKNVWDKIS